MTQQTEIGNILRLSEAENGKILILNQEPFSITFTWMDKYAKVKLKNGEDVLKLANIFSNMLTENGIENTIETSELKFQ